MTLQSFDVPAVPPPGRRPASRADSGSVTVEAAIAILALAVVTGLLAWCVALVGAQLAVGEAARAAARLASRGESEAAVVAEARRAVPAARVAMVDDDGRVRVEVECDVHGPGVLARLGAITLAADATASREGPTP